jgi:hypothetical protein
MKQSAFSTAISRTNPIEQVNAVDILLGGTIKSNLSWITANPLITRVPMSHSIQRNNRQMRIGMWPSVEILKNHYFLFNYDLSSSNLSLSTAGVD